jgi:hypothetical protein
MRHHKAESFFTYLCQLSGISHFFVEQHLTLLFDNDDNVLTLGRIKFGNNLPLTWCGDDAVGENICIALSRTSLMSIQRGYLKKSTTSCCQKHIEIYQDFTTCTSIWMASYLVASFWRKNIIFNE